MNELREKIARTCNIDCDDCLRLELTNYKFEGRYEKCGKKGFCNPCNYQLVKADQLLSLLSEGKESKTGAELIAEERKRQIEQEGWSPEHDSQHTEGQLALAGAVYARHVVIPNITNVKVLWPWDMKWWKPTPNDPIRQLVKAGALIAAEIDRLNKKEGR